MTGISLRRRYGLLIAPVALLCITLGWVASRRPAPPTAAPERKLLKAIQESPADPSPPAALARRHLAAGRSNAALEVVRDAVRAFPADSVIRDLFVEALLGAGRYQEAVEVLRPLAPTSPQYALRLASAQVRSGDLDAARATVLLLSSDEQLSAPQRLQAGGLLLDTLDFTGAARMFEMPADAAASPEADAHLGYALIGSGSYSAAIPVLERAAAATPGAAAVQFYLGAAIRLSGDRARIPDAEAALARAAAAEPQDALIQYELALARVQLRQWEPAREALEASARLQPDLTEAQRDLSRIRGRTGDAAGAAVAQSRYLRLVGDPAAAVRLLEPLAARGNLDVTLELCEAYYDNLQTANTLKILKKLADQHPGERRVLEALFRGQRAADRNQEALDSLARVEALLPEGDRSLETDRVGLLREVGRYDDAEKLLRERVARTPEDAAAHFALGEALARWPTGANRDAEAEPVLRTVLTLDPDHVQAHYELGVILERTKRAPEAVEHLRAALDQSPTLKDAARVLGRALATTGETGSSQDAYAHYRRLEAREKEQKRLELPSSLYKATTADRLKLADFYIDAALRPGAISELEAVLRRDARNAEARRRLIALYGLARRFQRQFEERKLQTGATR